jgi:D-lyxose ketol-isomerase
LQGSQLRKAEGGENAPKPPKAQPLVASVSSVKQYNASEVRVTLTNGQVWQQAESRTGFWLEPGQTVTISPGVLGSYFLTNDQHQRVRVKRIL